MGRSDHLFSPQISDPTALIQFRRGRPFLIRRPAALTQTLGLGSTLFALAPEPLLAFLSDRWGPRLHGHLPRGRLLSHAAHAMAGARAGAGRR